MSREWTIETEIRDGIGDPIPVAAHFDRWNLIPLEAWSAFTVDHAELVDADGERREVDVCAALARLFDASVRRLEVDGESAQPAELSAWIRAELALRLIDARAERGKEQPTPSGAT